MTDHQLGTRRGSIIRTAVKRLSGGRLTLRGLLLAACLTPLLVMTASAEDDRPNILYIFTDDQTYRTVSCYPRAYNYANTPNIDSLAANGIRFDQAYIGAKCVPSRATALTGRLQFSVNANEDGSAIQGNTYWMPTVRDSGYYMGMIGKWHWGAGAAAHQHGTSWDWSVVWDHGAYKPYDSYYNNQYVMINGAPDTPLGGYSTDRYTDYAEQFINERAQASGSPWFLWVCYAGVHGPYTPADRHKGTLDGAPETAIPVDVFGPRPGKPSHFQDSKWTLGADGKPYFKGKSLDFWAKQQTEAVASIDEGVGRIVAALQATNQIDNTIIIFTSDQGYVWGNHGLKGKIDPYETAVRAPFIVSNPARFPVNKVCKAPINGPDVIRTFHAWANAEPALFMPGRDITPVLVDPESETVLDAWSETPTLTTYVQNRYEPLEMANRLANEDWQGAMYDTDTPWYFFINVKNFKYTRYANPDRFEELYDMDTDPEELVNLALLPQYKSKVLEMREACIQSIKDNGGAVFADLLPPPTTDTYWPEGVVPSDNAHVLHGSGVSQDDSEELKAGDTWGNSGSSLAYLRFDLNDVNEIDGYRIDTLFSATLNLWMTQTEGDAPNELQIYALVDGAQDSPSSLAEDEWTGSGGANPLLGTNLPQGNQDPAGSPLTTTLLGSHTFATTGDNTELGQLQIPLSLADFQSLVQNDTNRTITLVIRSTSSGLTANFASVGNTNAAWSPPTLTFGAPPFAPTGVSAAAFDSSARLTWSANAEPNVTYSVYRSTTSGSYGAPIASGLTETTYLDETAVNNTTYFYVVTASDSSANESLPSDEVSATPYEINNDVVFGSNNDGLGGFTASTPDASSESWSIQPDSVRYITDDPDGTVDSGTDGPTNTASLLRTFLVDRTVGSSYTFEGVVNLTAGYGDDNNRVGIYLFGDQSDLAVGSGETESGALGLIVNLDTNIIEINEGIDGNPLSPEVGLTGSLLGDALFGTTLTLKAEIAFTGNGGENYIAVRFTVTDANNDKTAVSTTVLASDYTGDYYGFVSRARNRGVTSSNRNAPFTMDYLSFSLAPSDLPAPPSGLTAAVDDGTVSLAWNDDTAPTVAGYNVYRSTSPGIYGAPIATALPTSSFVDTTVTNFASYSYVVTTTDSSGNESLFSPELTLTPAPRIDNVIFGSNSDGWAGFITSTPDASQESWSLQPDSVRYINDDPDGTPDSGTDGGTRTGSLLRVFPFDRSAGETYTIEGVVNLTDGYGDDNNRVGIYLFGKEPDLPAGSAETELGALGLMVNIDTNTIAIREGVDGPNLTGDVGLTGSILGDAFIGTVLTLRAELVFTEVILDDETDVSIDILFTVIDVNGAATAVSTTVLASAVVGDYFGFVSRGRNRGVTSSDRNAPFTLDYLSFRITDDSAIAGPPATPSGLVANPGDGVVNLDWDNNVESDLASYTVYRSLTPGSYGLPLAMGLTSSQYVDTAVVNGTTYYYVVTAVDTESLESPASAEASATPAEAPSILRFGSNYGGLAGFMQSTVAAGQSWTTQTESVQYRSENTGTVNSSFLRAFPLDRSPGKTYKVEGVVTLTDGYADDNNRVGIYLFGDFAEIPNEDEAGAIGMIFNMDDTSADGPPGNNLDDDISLLVGIDNTNLSGEVKRNQTDTPFAQDLFGTTVTFTAIIAFSNNGVEDRIQIDATLTEESGAESNVSTSVAAADYTGDYFGFVTRCRIRNFGVENDPQSAPFVMDYRSFSVSEQSSPQSYLVEWSTGWGPNIGLITNDYEFDGLNNLLEYALGGNPLLSDGASILPEGSLVPEGGSNWMYFAYDRRVDAVERGLTYTVYSGTNLVGGLTNVVPVWSVSPPVNGFERVTHRISIDGTSGGFMQLRVAFTE